MATDSTNLPLGETNVDAGTDMTGSELDLTAVQLAQVEGAQPIELPKGNQVILIPVQPGQVIELPTDSTNGLLAKIGPAPEGNLAIVVDGRTIILQGYVHANEQSPVKVVTNDGDTVDVADVVAATDPTLDIQTAAGPATNPGDTTPDSSGIFVPFGPGADLGGLHAAGILDPTALQYKLIDDDRKDFHLDEDTGPTSINITFDILGGVINEDDLEGAQIIEQPNEFAAAKLVFQTGGNDGVGNDPFDDDGNVNDKAGGTSNDGVPDSDLEPLVTVATVKVNFNGDIPGKLVIDDSVLPSGLTSDGQPIVYDVVPVLGHGNGIVGFIDNGGTPGEFDKGTDRLVFTVLVDEPASNSEFHVIFTLYDNIDNEAPDQNGDGAADLLGANEQTLDLPVKLTAIDSDGTPLSAVMHLGVTDDIPFLGQAVDVGEGERSIVITPGDANITHDESWFPQPDADDQSIFDPSASSAAFDAGQKVHDAGFSFPYGDSVGSLFGIAQSQVLASFGADQASTEFYAKGPSDSTARNSIFGELEDRIDADGDGLNDGENEHPFELFMIANGSGPDATPTEDNLKTPGNEGNLTIEDQATNATVTWNGDQILQVFLHQIDAHTIVGYVIPEGEEAPAARESMVPELDNGQEAVFVLTIDDNGVMTFVQYHQINHDVDGPTHPDHDDPFQILGEDGTPIIQVRISDHDGDHATQPVNLVIQDDGPHFIKTFWGFDGDSTNPFNGTGLIDEDKLPNGNSGGPGDDKGGTHADGKVFFDFGVDQPGHLAVQGLQIKDSHGNVVATVAADGSFDGISSLHTADGRGVEIQISGPDGNGVVTWQAVVAAGETGEGDPVFTLTLDTAGADLGEFDFDLHQALDHPFQDSDSENDGPETSFEDNLNFDFTVRGFDVDGDWADGHIKLSVDDDSPDACKVDIRIDDGEGGDGLLVQDETSGVQNGGNNSGDKDPNASGQDEDDVSPAPADFPAFEAAKGLLSNLGYAATQITVDLSGGTLDADAAIGADVPGTVSPVSIVGAGGAPLNGAATNLFDTQTGERIYLFTETVGGETFVVGHVGNTTDIGGNALGPISFALHTTESGDLELGQYRAIQHPDTSNLDESVTLLGDNNENAVVYLQVTVTDADGDSVVVNRPLGGEGEKGSAIVFQDDGPTIHCTQNSISLAVDESVGGDGTDLNTPFPEGVLDGPAIENDEELVSLPTALTGLGTAIGAATAHGADLFTFNAGVDGEKSHAYTLTIGGLGATGLHDTAKGQPITLTDAGIIDGLQVVEGKNTDGDIIFAISIDPATGAVSVAQYLAIDHGGEENEDGGAHDELVSLGYGSLSITLSVTDGDNDTVTKSHDISQAVTFDDDAPDVTLGSGTLALQMDESVSLSLKDVDDPSQPDDGVHDGSAIEGDVIANAGALLASGLAFLGIPIGGAAGNVGSLFNVDYGSDGPGTTTYQLKVTSLGGATDLVDTATQTTVTLSLVSGHIEGRDGFGHLVFAVAIDPNTGDIVTAQYRAIDHGDEEGTPGAFDEVKFLTDNTVAVVATVTDKDGDFDTLSRDISHGISFDDDGPKFIKTFWGLDHDATDIFNGIGLIDEDALPHGKSGGPGDDAGGVSTDGQIIFDFGSDQPGSLKIDSLKVTNSLGNSIALADLHTADGQPLVIDQSAPDGNGVVSLIAYVDLGGGKHGDKVFEFDIDTKGSDIGEFQFTLFKPLEHPFTDSDSQNNGPDTAFEDNLNFDFTIIGTDGDGDSDTGHIKIKIDDDSPVAVNDTDSVTEGKGNIATGNVVTGVDGSFFGPDANGTDGSKDAPGADEPYTISKLSHDGHNYTLSADGLTVLKDNNPLVGPEGFDGKTLTITTHEGATFQIVLISNTLSEVGSYKYTAGDPPLHHTDVFAGPADAAASNGAAFDTLGEWQSSFAAAGITVTGTGGAGTIVLKPIDVAGSGDYRGLGVSSAGGDEPEVDNAGPDESMKIGLPNLTNNATLTLGALFDGHQFDGGNQEIVLWQVFNGVTLVASGQILGSDNGLVSLDIDTGGSQFDNIVLTPLNNGAGADAANNSDFLLLNVEVCKQADIKEDFNYTLEDADGDKSTATLSINVADTQPSIPPQTSGGLSILVDEDGLNPSGTIKDGIGDHNTNDAEEDHTGANAINDDAKHIGTIPFVAGADPVTIELSVDNKGDTGLNTLSGKNIFAAWDPEEQQLVGYVEGTDPSDAANQVFIMHIDGQSPGAFNYTFTLLQPIQHADGGQDDNTENNPDPYFNIGIQIEDKDCDVAYTTLKVTIDDDMPVVQISADANGTTQHDETAGRQTDAGDDDQSGSVPALFNVAGLPPVGTAIGWAHDGDSVVNLTGARYGADGPGTTAYALHIPADGTDSGVDTTDGHNIWLYQGPNGIIVGREGDATNVPNPAGAIIFAVSIDSDGELTVVQYDSLKHPTFPNEYDEDIGLNTDALQAVVTLTDADGDSASGSANIGSLVRFDDDGPKAKIDDLPVNVQHDETAGVQNPGDGDMDQAAALPANLVAVGTLIGWAKSNSAVVTTAASSYGADDEGGTTVLSLKVSSAGVDSGLDITTGESIFLYKEGDVAVGRVGSGIGGNTPDPLGNVAFVVSIDTDGKLNVAQYLSIHHDNTASVDETAQMSDSALQVVVTVTDGDGDVATDSHNIGSHVRFDDDGPTANPDTDSVKEDAAENYASGNVVTAVDGGIATDTNLTDGAKDSGGADGIKAHSVQWADTADAGGIDSNNSIAGKYGTLQVDDTGNYKYVLDNTNTDVNKLNDGEHLTETFTYYVKDGDDDKTSSTLTITIDGHTDAFPPEARDANAYVDEDGIPVIGNHDIASGDDDADQLPDTATPDEHIFKATLPVGWNGNPGTITLAPGDLSALRTIDNHTINVTGSGTGLLQGIDSVTSQVVFTVQILNATTGEYQVTLSKPLLHPDSDNNHANDAADFGLNGYEDNLTIPVDVTYTNIGGSVTKALSIDVDDDMPFVAPTTSGTISLAVDETFGGGAVDDPHNPGTTVEGDEALVSLPSQLTSIPGTVIGAAQAGAAGLFASSAGADGEFDHSYELTVTNGGATGLTDTATGLPINLVKVGDVVQGQVGAGPSIAFAFYIDETTGQVSMAQYRAIVHGDTTNPDDVRLMIGNQGVLAVTLTVIDNDGDKASLSRDISGAVSFDDDGPHSAVISFVAGKDTLDDEGSPLVITSPGIDGATIPAEDVANTPSTVSFDVSVDAGKDGLGSIAYNLAQIQSQNAGLKAVDGTADGAPIVFSLVGGDIVGKISEVGNPLDGKEVLRVHATDSDSYTVTESSPLFHSGQGEVNDLTFNVVLDVTDKDGDSIQTTAAVKIDDDMPDAQPDGGTASATPRMNTNLLLVLDDSGSMSESTTLTNTNKLQALQGAVNELLEQYGNLGSVRICLVRFDSNSSTLHGPSSEVWLTIDQAKALLATLSADNNTNYDAALLEAMASYQTNTGTDHKLTAADVTGPIQNVGYFISDGVPNNNNDWSSNPYHLPGWVAPATAAGVGAGPGGAGIDTEEEYLQNFLNQEDIKMYAIGIGNGIDATAATELKHISYDGTGAGNDDDLNLYIELKDLSQLSQALVGTVVVPISGNIGDFGADAGFVSQITLTGGTVVNYDHVTDSASGVAGTGVSGGSYNSATGDLTLNLTTGSTITINVKTGAWSYSPAAGDSATYNFGFTLTDFDGDTDSNILSVSATQSGFKPIVRDDQIVSNIEDGGSNESFIVPGAALLWNDTDKDGDPLTLSSVFTNVANLVSVGLTAGDVTIVDGTGGGSFIYSASSTDGSDTGNATLFRGQQGEDTLDGNGLDNILVGRDSKNDTILAYQGNDVAIGGSGDDTIDGGDGRDWLVGGDGNDTLRGGAGNDLIEGGAGTKDVLDYSTVSGNWDLTLGAGGSGTADVDGHDTYSGIEGIIGGSGDNKLTGNANNNYLDGGSGSDTLDGAAGDDTLLGGDDGDTITGGTGTDNLNGGNSSDTYIFNAGDGTDTITDASGTTDKIQINGTINALSAARSGNDLVLQYGTSSLTDQITVVNHFTGGNDIEQLVVAAGAFAGTYNVPQGLTGGVGSDIIAGTSAGETLNGGAGADLMFGQGGNDTYVVDNSGDKLFEASGGGTDLVQASINFTLDTEFENLTLTTNADLNGTGNSAANIINGNSGINTLLGLDGADTLNGNDGNDTLDGGNDAFADSLNGGNGNDTLIWRGTSDTYDGGNNTDTLDVSAVASLDFTAIGDATISNIEVIKLTGGSGTAITLNANDVINDFETSDSINPGGSNGGKNYDSAPALTIDGDAGTDSVTLTSGAGDSWFNASANGATGVPAGYTLYVHIPAASGLIPDNEDAYVLVKTGVGVTLS